MSLFRAREFWSFDVNQLRASYLQSGNSAPGGSYEPADNPDDGQAPLGFASSSVKNDSDSAEDDNEGSCIFATGQFHSIGHQNVFVCADLSGFVCIVQVPETQQTFGSLPGKESAAPSASASDPTKPAATETNSSERQLLAVKQVAFPVVDIKCGYFLSALKQSIAVLSYDKLVIYQVKRHQVDLLSMPNLGDNNEQMLPAAQRLDENLLSHELIEHHRVELLGDQMASHLTVLNYIRTNELLHADEQSRDSEKRQHKYHNNQKHSHHGHHNHAFHLLPQRDTIVVQYTNQLLFSLLDHKKVVAHYALQSPDDHNSGTVSESGQAELRVQEHAQYLGYMPMGFLLNHRASYLVVSMSDHRVYCLDLTKLVALAKQEVMKRVALNLLSDGLNANTDQKESKTATRSSLAYDNVAESDTNQNKDRAKPVSLDLSSAVCEWQVELACQPIQMQAVHRQARESSIGPRHPVSQLLIASRYQLDLVSINGQHLWSQRFEAPVICIHSYALETVSDVQHAVSNATKQPLHNDEFCDRLITLVCSDCFSKHKCNLTIFDDDRIVWSSLLNSKPTTLVRANLSKIQGALASLDINESRLSASYLGTNLPDLSEQATNSAETMDDDGNNPLLHLDSLDLSGLTDAREKQASAPLQLKFDIKLEASDEWPNVSVDSRVSIQPELDSSHGVLQNIVAAMEFDDLLVFEPAESIAANTCFVSQNVVQIKLGCYWPDRREPITFSGRFSNLPQPNSAENLTHDANYARTMPKSLKVKIYLRFSETHLGVLMQEELFLLPLSMVAPLVHIDYSSGLQQGLDDVLSNLSLYKRQSVSSATPPPYYLCDIFIKEPMNDFIELVDDLIESDLICRGMNTESSSRLLSTDDRLGEGEMKPGRNMTTLENISLLAQSLDCRLKYQSLAHPASSTMATTRQSSEDNSSAVVLSLALRMPSGSQLIAGLPTNSESNLDAMADGHSLIQQTLVWLHLVDLSAANSSIPEELINLHMKEYKLHNSIDNHTVDTDYKPNGCPILLSIESDHPMPLLFLQNHLVARIAKRYDISYKHSLKLNRLVEPCRGPTGVSILDFIEKDPFIAISANLNTCLDSALQRYDHELVREFKRLKEQLCQDYCKFHISTMTSLSLAKKLYNLPDTMQSLFTNLSRLTKQYQLNLIKTLSQLENLKKLDYLYSKVSGSSDIVVASGQKNNQLIRWPVFEQEID